MLKKLYVDNFRCLVNFELNLSPLVLLMGLNGSGKSTVFDVLFKLRQFITGESTMNQIFNLTDLTRWQSNNYQTFNLEIEGSGGTYLFELVIEHDREKNLQKIKKENILFNQKPLFIRQDGNVQIYNDNNSPISTFPYDYPSSAFGQLQLHPDNHLLKWFKNRIAKFIVVSIQPVLMQEISARAERTLSRNAETFASWYRYLSLERQSQILELTQELRKIMPGFHMLSLPEFAMGQSALYVYFSTNGGNFDAIPYKLSELSDGQRVMIVLYALLYGVSGLGYSLFLDEPENFLALPEIQPWLMKLADSVGEQIPQVMLISHHPEIINYLGASDGIWLERKENGQVRVKYKIDDYNSGLELSESVARGWVK